MDCKGIKECTFQQWLDYMYNGATEASKPTLITANISQMSVDQLAQELQDHGYTGKYILHHVVNGVNKLSGETPTLQTAPPVHGETPAIGYE
ncbi:hypothetical protein BDW75DRAFT_241741 [Aspergillus navahoensis]